jgi:hypothetical protein
LVERKLAYLSGGSAEQAVKIDETRRYLERVIDFFEGESIRKIFA